MLKLKCLKILNIFIATWIHWALTVLYYFHYAVLLYVKINRAIITIIETFMDSFTKLPFFLFGWRFEKSCCILRLNLKKVFFLSFCCNNWFADLTFQWRKNSVHESSRKFPLGKISKFPIHHFLLILKSFELYRVVEGCFVTEKLLNDKSLHQPHRSK